MKFLRKTNYYEGVVYEWNLPSGFSCPSALECLVKVDRVTGKFENKSTDYRCYSAMQERFPTVREHRWKNFDFLRNGGIPEIPIKAKHIRIHMSGDFYSQNYFNMWLKLCEQNNEIEFWAYTKSVNYWVNKLNEIPNNLILTASRGGKYDYLIEIHNLKNVEVIKKKEDAKGRPIDLCDDQARIPNINFCLLDNFSK
tara:strand:+ start:716 stop:1306 length:591 start_codon:yes stop_codon:yes gene_type:complete